MYLGGEASPPYPPPPVNSLCAELEPQLLMVRQLDCQCCHHWSHCRSPLSGWPATTASGGRHLQLPVISRDESVSERTQHSSCCRCWRRWASPSPRSLRTPPSPDPGPAQSRSGSLKAFLFSPHLAYSGDGDFVCQPDLPLPVEQTPRTSQVRPFPTCLLTWSPDYLSVRTMRLYTSLLTSYSL